MLSSEDIRSFTVTPGSSSSSSVFFFLFFFFCINISFLHVALLSTTVSVEMCGLSVENEKKGWEDRDTGKETQKYCEIVKRWKIDNSLHKRGVTASHGCLPSGKPAGKKKENRNKNKK